MWSQAPQALCHNGSRGCDNYVPASNMLCHTRIASLTNSSKLYLVTPPNPLASRFHCKSLRESVIRSLNLRLKKGGNKHNSFFDSQFDDLKS